MDSPTVYNFQYQKTLDISFYLSTFVKIKFTFYAQPTEAVSHR